MATVVLHADDVSFCCGANDAFIELTVLGVITSGSVMVPCGWLPDLIERIPEGIDIGVHLTATSEHAGFRWAPISRPSASAGLTDRDGYMWASVAEVRANAHPEALIEEFRAQIEFARAAGLQLSHLDAHMGTALAPEFCQGYLDLAREFNLVPLVPTKLSAYGPASHMSEVTDVAWEASFSADGVARFDRVLETDFGRAPGISADYRALFEGLGDDEMVYCALHPCAPGDVSRIDPKTQHVRTDEYELFNTATWHEWLTTQPHRFVSMTEVAEAAGFTG